MLDLSRETAIAFGGEREIYPFPNDPSRILKLLVGEDREAKGGPARRMFRSTFSGFRTWLIWREYQEYLRLSVKHMARTRALPITHMFGFVPTNRGMACVSETVRTPGGALGPPLREVIKRGPLQDHEIEALSAMAADLVAIGARCSDLTVNNIVLGHRTIYSNSTPFEAVLVDGFGDTHAIPIRSMSKRANTVALHRRLGRIGRQAGLMWDRDGLSYSRAG